MLVLITVIVYFAVLLLLSHLVDKRGGNAAFFTGNRQSPWPLVAFGMIGATISAMFDCDLKTKGESLLPRFIKD